MNVIDSLVPNPAWLVYLGNLAVASLAVYAVALLAERLARRRALPFRHLLLVCGLGGSIAAPLILGVLTLTRLAPFEFVATSANAASEATPEHSEMPAVTRPAWQEEALANTPRRTTAANRHAPATPAAERTLTDSAVVASERALAPPAESVSLGKILRICGATLVLVWLVGSMYQVVMFVRGLAGIHRLLRLVEPVSDSRIQRIAIEAARSLGMRGCPRLSQSTSLDAPVSIGLLRGQIVLPASQVIEWPDQAWHALLVHELAHIKRSDLQIGLLQRLALILYWWNPLARRTSARIASLREQICDDLVTQHGTHDDGYAALLLELASRVAGRNPVATALGAVDGSPGELTERVHRLLEPERKLVTSLSRVQAIAVAAFGAALLLATGGTTVRWAVAAEPPQAEVPAETVSQSAAEKVLGLINDAEQDKPRQKRVRVVDLAGEPVAEATVSVWAFHSAQGHTLWTKGHKFLDDPPTVTTDAEGRATIPFPKYGNPVEKIPMDMLTCVVKHPEFATTRYNEVNVRPESLTEEAAIQIAPGARVTIRPTAEGVELDRQRLFVTWSSPTDSYAVRETGDGGLELPRLSAGPELIRVVYLPENGAAMFSDVIEQELTDGADVQLDVKLHPSATVVGKVNPSVPRPIQNGILSAMTIDSTGKALNKLSWRTAADIDAEGNFRLEDLPAGSELQVIALCDGYMATSGDAPDSVPEKERKLARSQSAPQVFRVDEKLNEITLAMTPTVECAITVVDQDSKPIEGAKIYFMPNIKWWNGGSQLYCHPRFTMKDILLDKDYRSVYAGERQPSPFEATSGADGVAVVRNLPPNLNRFVIQADGYEMPIKGKSRTQSVDLSEGGRHELTVVLQPKSEKRLGNLP